MSIHIHPENRKPINSSGERSPTERRCRHRRHVALAAVLALRVRRADLLARRAAGVTRGTVLTHERLVRDDRRRCEAQPLSPCGNFE